ncbi:MAG: hypothetical protein LWW92_01265 [Rhodocyclales bacterium]|nr:hypothetical protein [Rhodocyclales bacterium]
MAATSLETLAETVRQGFLQRNFGSIRFWRFAVVRPSDQSYVLVDVRTAGDRLDLVFRHASGQGQEGVLSVWQPEGLSLDGVGLSLQRANRLRLDDSEAWTDGGREYHIRTPRGEGAFEINDAGALRLEP